MPNKVYDYFLIENLVIDFLLPRQKDGKTEYPQLSQSDLKKVINKHLTEILHKKPIDDPQIKRVIDLYLEQKKIQPNKDETYQLATKFATSLDFSTYPWVSSKDVNDEIIATFLEYNYVHFYELLTRKALSRPNIDTENLRYFKKELDTTLHDKERLVNYLNELVDELFTYPKTVTLETIGNINKYFFQEMTKFTTDMKQSSHATDDDSQNTNNETV